MPAPTFIKSSGQNATEGSSNGDGAAARKVHRLTSISQFAKSFTRRRSIINSSDSSPTSNVLSPSISNTVSPTKITNTMVPRSSLVKKSPEPASLDLCNDDVPRSLPFSRQSRPASRQQSRQGSLPAASHLPNLFVPSRIHTRCGSNRRLSQTLPACSMGLSPVHASVPNKSLHTGVRRASVRLSLDANVLSRKSAEGSLGRLALDPTRIRLPDWEQNIDSVPSRSRNDKKINVSPRSTDDYKSRDTPKMINEGLEKQRVVEETHRKQVTSSKIHPLAHGRQPSKGHEIVRHGLLKAIDPALALEAAAAIAAPRAQEPEARLSSASHGSLSPRSPEKAGRTDRDPILVLSSSLKMISPNHSRASPQTLSRSPTNMERPVCFIYKAQPSAYWTGRFVSLNDRLMNEFSDIPQPSVDGNKLLMHAREGIRFKKIFASLEHLCQSEEASRSLAIFRRQFALKCSMPELSEDQNTGRQSRYQCNSQNSCESEITDENIGFYVAKAASTKDPVAPGITTPGVPLTSPVSESSSAGLETSGKTLDKGRKSSLVERLIGKSRWGSQSGSGG